MERAERSGCQGLLETVDSTRHDRGFFRSMTMRASVPFCAGERSPVSDVLNGIVRKSLPPIKPCEEAEAVVR